MIGNSYSSFLHDEHSTGHKDWMDASFKEDHLKVPINNGPPPLASSHKGYAAGNRNKVLKKKETPLEYLSPWKDTRSKEEPSN